MCYAFRVERQAHAKLRYARLILSLSVWGNTQLLCISMALDAKGAMERMLASQIMHSQCYQVKEFS